MSKLQEIIRGIVAYGYEVEARDDVAGLSTKLMIKHFDLYREKRTGLVVQVTHDWLDLVKDQAGLIDSMINNVVAAMSRHINSYKDDPKDFREHYTSWFGGSGDDYQDLLDRVKEAFVMRSGLQQPMRSTDHMSPENRKDYEELMAEDEERIIALVRDLAMALTGQEIVFNGPFDADLEYKAHCARLRREHGIKTRAEAKLADNDLW